MKIQDRARRFGTESAFKVLARARALEAKGKDVVHLEIGQPDFPTPDAACQAGIRAIQEGQTGYGPTPGLPDLRRAIAKHAGELRGMEIAPEQIIVTPGGKPVLYYVINALAGEGDEVIYPDPAFPMYPSIIAHSGATGVPLRLKESVDFRFDPDEFRRLLSPKTSLIILNSPQNPTGGVLDHETLAVIAEEAIQRDIPVLSDEIYSRILYDEEFQSIASFPGMAERTIILDGFSKTYAMTGWRLGYVIANLELTEIFERYNVNIISCVTTFAQFGAIEALRMDQSPVEEMVAEFHKRRDYLIPALNEINGLQCATPGGAFYAFPNITATGMSSRDFADRLLDEAGVATLDGGSFGAGGEGYIRISYASSMANLEEAVRRIANFLK